MNKYRDKSDFEINKAVAAFLGCTAEYENESVTVFRNNNGGMPLVVSATADSSDNFDPCNNPAYAMPIVIENDISLHAPRLREGWMAEYTGSDDDVNDGFQADYFDSHNQNPLRAAMEVFLMMKDAENEK